MTIMKKALKIGGIGFVALIVLGILFGSDEEPEVAEAAPVVTTTVVDSTTTEAPTTTLAPTTTTTEAQASSGDWVSVEAYIAEMGDSLTKTTDLAYAVVDVLENVAAGVYSPEVGATLLETARDTLDSHRVYFRNTEAPDGFGEAHRLIQEGWDTWDEAFLYLIDGVRYLDTASVDEATRLMNEATALMGRATDAMPAGMGGWNA